jgi:hypothetical protein
MADVPRVDHEVPLSGIRDAAEKVAPEARRKAFEAGTDVAYAKEGRIIRESADGRVFVVGPSIASDVVVRKRVWKLA